LSEHLETKQAKQPIGGPPQPLDAPLLWFGLLCCPSEQKGECKLAARPAQWLWRNGFGKALDKLAQKAAHLNKQCKSGEY